MSQEIISKETIYNGYRFRSRLEARWAVFFDLIGVQYQYEPDAFICEDGSQYTPDFFLPNSFLRYSFQKGLYLEIKYIGWNTNTPEVRREIGRISSAMPESNLVLFCGDPYDVSLEGSDNENEQLCPDWDNYMVLVYCEKCKVLKATFSEGNYMYCPICEDGRSDIRPYAQIARQYRFPYFNNQNTKNQ